MTTAQLQRRVEHWQRVLAELGIGHWRIEELEIVDETPGGPQGAASVSSSAQYASVWFKFQREYVNEAPPGRVDETIVHEWLHVALRDLEHGLEGLRSWMPEAAYTAFEDRHEHETEGLVEGLARLIVRLHG